MEHTKTMSERMEEISSVIGRLDNLRNIAARAWPSGVVIGFCPKCLFEREFGWDEMAKMMAEGLRRCKCSGQRIDFKDKQ